MVTNIFACIVCLFLSALHFQEYEDGFGIFFLVLGVISFVLAVIEEERLNKEVRASKKKDAADDSQKKGGEKL